MLSNSTLSSFTQQNKESSLSLCRCTVMLGYERNCSLRLAYPFVTPQTHTCAHGDACYCISARCALAGQAVLQDGWWGNAVRLQRDRGSDPVRFWFYKNNDWYQCNSAGQGCGDHYRAASPPALRSSPVMDGPCITLSQICNLGLNLSAAFPSMRHIIPYTKTDYPQFFQLARMWQAVKMYLKLSPGAKIVMVVRLSQPNWTARLLL